jgi:hypothetical protein
MSELQKVIKYCSMGLAAFLAFLIISGIASGIFAAVGILDHSSSSSTSTIDYDKGFQNVKSLNAENGLGKFYIKLSDSDEVRVVAENVPDDFKADMNFSGELKISNEFNFWNFFGGRDGFTDNSKVTVYIPSDFVAENVKISAGAGDVTIEALTTEKLDFEAGAGNLTGTNIKAEKVKLDGGVGEISLEQVEFSDTDVDSGVGNITLQGVLKGKNKIDCGIGEVTLNIEGSTDDYNLKVDKGLGSISINGEEYSDLNWDNLTADNSLDIDGGVGDIDINFEE